MKALEVTPWCDDRLVRRGAEIGTLALTTLICIEGEANGVDRQISRHLSFAHIVAGAAQLITFAETTPNAGEVKVIVGA
jgi:hypothetical protein